MRPRLLDLFCKAGGGAVGYHRAGFDVVGVDIEPQPRYPFEFHQLDALDVLAGDSPLGKPNWFDAVHASPPCQRYSRVTRSNHGRYVEHPDLVGPVRDLLVATGKPYVIENVVGAPLKRPVMVCGSYFGLRVRRHRLFESNVLLRGTYCTHKKQGTPICVAGTGARRINRRVNDRGGACNFPRNVAEAREVMGIDWMTRAELSQAIPPAYCEFIGRQLIKKLG